MGNVHGVAGEWLRGLELSGVGPEEFQLEGFGANGFVPDREHFPFGQLQPGSCCVDGC